MKMIKVFYCAILFFIPEQGAYAGQQLWDIYTSVYLNRAPEFTGASLDSLVGDTVFIKAGNVTHKIAISRITKIKQVKRSKAIQGTIIGALIGGGLFYLISKDADNRSRGDGFINPVETAPIAAILGATGGGAVGFGIGHFGNEEKGHIIASWSLEDKKELIKKLVINSVSIVE
ncbi:MAG: hypothetical protein Kow00108_02470 [Calditrichia bacterium]